RGARNRAADSHVRVERGGGGECPDRARGDADLGRRRRRGPGRRCTRGVGAPGFAHRAAVAPAGPGGRAAGTHTGSILAPPSAVGLGPPCGRPAPPPVGTPPNPRAAGATLPIRLRSGAAAPIPAA